MRTIANVLRRGKVTLLTVVVALTLVGGSTALAGTGVGGAFNLGKINTVNAITKLAGSVPGASLVVDNNSTDPAATALNLQVEPGKAPMKVNSQTKVANLNADSVDGVDSTGFYAAGSKVADSSHADQADSATSAQNADKLDGMDSASFGRVLAAGATTFDVPSVPGNFCEYRTVDPPEAAADDISNDLVLVMPDGSTLNTFVWSVAAVHSNLPTVFRVQFCNQTTSTLDPPSTRVDWIVFDK